MPRSAIPVTLILVLLTLILIPSASVTIIGPLFTADIDIPFGNAGETEFTLSATL